VDGDLYLKQEQPLQEFEVSRHQWNIFVRGGPRSDLRLGRLEHR